MNGNSNRNHIFTFGLHSDAEKEVACQPRVGNANIKGGGDVNSDHEKENVSDDDECCLHLHLQTYTADDYNVATFLLHHARQDSL